ncbi:putative inorganic phosphate cotransporter [Adelges cooleyi]|uniref:putative inorganic phosphate cotransporter n=1 Tax=Adelges cooleyi TaxID=133065 RepID=UPI00217F6378|nr:putative inorganic phosphate cotransporter [Adelges cooleyi]
MELSNDSTIDRIASPELKKGMPMIGVRHLQSLLAFTAIFTGYLLRVNMSVAIVAMVPVVNSTDFYEEHKNHIATFDWTHKTRSYLLSSFFAGYLLGNFPAAILGCYFNNKLLLALSTTITSLLALATPVAVSTYGSPVLFIIRFLQGLAQAFLLPMCHGIMARWVPPNERGRLVGFVMSGIQFGTMITLIGAGYLASTSFGWPSIFYASGAIGLAWTVVWLLLGAESPQTHWFLSQKEANYIQESLQGVSHHGSQADKVTPWKGIFTSLPVWATTAAHVGYNWGFWLLLSEMPTFISTVHGFNLREDGLLSSLPYLAMFLLQLPASYLADFLNKRQCTTLTMSRKIWTTISMWGGAAGLITLGYLDDNATFTIYLYIFVVAIGGTCNLGFNINHMDLSPNYAGLLMGITNTMASTGGLTAPLAVGYIISDPNSVNQWRVVFFLGAGVLFFANLIYLIFGSAKTQSWNSPEKKIVS